MPEVSDQEYKILSGAKQLLDNVMSHPQARLIGERAIKMVHPTAITTADRAKPFIDEINKISGEVKALRDERTSEKANSKLEAGYEHLRSKRHYTDDGITKIKQFQADHGIADPVVAADAWERRNPKPAPQQPGYLGTGWNFGDPSEDAADKLLWTNPDRFAEQETAAVLREYARGNEDY